MFNALRQRLVDLWLVQAPAIWGKLPNQADYVRHRCSAAEAQDWQHWVSQVWLRRSVKPRARIASKNIRKWIELDAPKPEPDLAFVPVSFILLPGAMSFAPRHFVQGVCVASQDRVGRECPLIIYQKISPYWLSRIFAAEARATQPSVSASSGKTEKHNDTARLLFWLARISARIHAADLPPEALAQVVDEVWMQFEPGWKQLFGRDAHVVPHQVLQQSLARQAIAEDSLDTASGLRGVSRLPWTNWPQRLLSAEQPVPAFWQQDIEGAYVNASDSLFSLWRNSL